MERIQIDMDWHIYIYIYISLFLYIIVPSISSQTAIETASASWRVGGVADAHHLDVGGAHLSLVGLHSFGLHLAWPVGRDAASNWTYEMDGPFVVLMCLFENDGCTRLGNI